MTHKAMGEAVQKMKELLGREEASFKIYLKFLLRSGINLRV